MIKYSTYFFISIMLFALILGGCKTKQQTVSESRQLRQAQLPEQSIHIDTKTKYAPTCEHRTLLVRELTQKDKYDMAYKELETMLNGETEPDFERAVFISENPYHNNAYTYQNFQQSINWHLLFIESLIAANDKSDTMDFDVKVNSNGRFKMDDIRYLPKEKKELYTKALSNWAIFTYLTDTTALFPFYNLPFTYSTQDPFGIKDWTNSQVIGLLTSEEKQGNCYAMTALFKILADRLDADARLCTAPQHIYIQHRDPKGHYYNVELATAGHPADGMIQVLTHTTSDAIKSGIALRNYDEKQSIGLCLINLAKSYEHSFDTKDDDFMLQCAELVLKYDGLNLNALLLKQQILDARIIRYAKANNIEDINTLKRDSLISQTMMDLEKHTTNLYNLGYRQMPLDMQEMVLTGINKTTVNKNPSPFTTIKPKDPRDAEYVTLSGGVFQEVFETKTEETFGNFVYNTTTKTLTKLNPSLQNPQLIDPVAFAYDFGARIYDARLGRWLSTDPLQAKYPHLTPYNAFENNPIYFQDPDGRDAIVSIVGNTITIKAKIYISGKDANEAKAKQMQESIMAAYSGGTYVDENGKKYTVKFDIQVQTSDKFKPLDKDAEGENFVKLSNKNSSSNPSFVQGKQGQWDSDQKDDGPTKSKKIWEHETGHFLGLGDGYFWVEQEAGMGNGWVSKEPELVRSEQITNPKDLMWNSSSEGIVTQRMIDEIAKAALSLTDGKDGTGVLKSGTIANSPTFEDHTKYGGGNGNNQGQKIVPDPRMNQNKSDKKKN